MANKWVCYWAGFLLDILLGQGFARADVQIDSMTSFGFAIESDSQFGDNQLSGSVIELAAVWPKGESMLLGLKTIAAGGGHGSQESFYRLSSGLSLNHHVWRDWWVEGFLGFYSHSHLRDGYANRAGTGRQWMVAWLQRIEVGPKFSLQWGGFQTGQRGRMQRGDDHRSASRGIKMSVVMTL